MPQVDPIVVIGGSRGTGLLIARLLAHRGEAVRVPARNPAGAAARLGAKVPVVQADITKPETLPSAVADAKAIILTAGAPSGVPAGRKKIEATDYEGVLNVIAAARGAGFAGRFLYMTSCGVTRASLAGTFLNLIKGDTLYWRRLAEDAIRASGLDYTIIRVGFLLNRPGGKRRLLVTQEPLPLALRYHIARPDVAEVFVAALGSPHASRTTFDVVWGKGPATSRIEDLLRGLEPDAAPAPATGETGRSPRSFHGQAGHVS